jgi:hypothetical protein
MASSITGSRESLESVVEQVTSTFERIKPYGLDIEVFATALIYLQEHPEVSIAEALQVGLNDWDV